MAEKEKKQRFSTLVIDGVKYRTNLTEKYKRRVKYEEDDPSKIKAFIPGTISKIYFKDGKNVKAGEIVLILEAMKMMNSVVSPADGAIKLKVKEKQVVAKNQVLFEIK